MRIGVPSEIKDNEFRVAIDQGGCVEGVHPTTHSNPTFEVDGVIHYCVANMPGAVPRTSTIALTNATLPFTRTLANLGFERAVRENGGLAEGVNVLDGSITYRAVAESQGREYVELSKLMKREEVGALPSRRTE